MIAPAALLLGMAYLGLVLAGVLPDFGIILPARMYVGLILGTERADTPPVPSIVTAIGWAMVLLPVIGWRVILTGVRQSGGLLLVLLVVAVLASVVSGDDWLWNQFF